MSVLWYDASPELWESHRLKFFYKEVDYRSQTGNEEMLSVSHITGVTPRSQKNVTMFMAESNIGLKICQIDDIVVNTMWAWMAALGVSAYYGIVSPSYGVYRALKDVYNPKYLNLLLRTEDYRAEYMRRSTGIRSSRLRLYSDKFLDIRFILPPRNEQDQIVRYLDWKVSQINKLINAKRRQIVLMQEQKQAVINDAITNKNNNWDNKPLKYWAKSNLLSLGGNINPDYELEYLDISSIGHGFIKQKPTKYIFSEAPSRARRIVQYGDTIISNVRTYLRSVCFIDHEIENCVVSTGFSVLTPNKNMVLPELLSFALSSDAFIDEVIKNSIGVSYPAINDNKLMSLKITLPKSIDEQKKLYANIKEQFDLFDIISLKIQQKISTLLEYRTRLISDVITGKLDVRSVVIPEYEATEDITVVEAVDDTEETED